MPFSDRVDSGHMVENQQQKLLDHPGDKKVSSGNI